MSPESVKNIARDGQNYIKKLDERKSPKDLLQTAEKHEAQFELLGPSGVKRDCVQS
jgi:hypothetical protein